MFSLMWTRVSPHNFPFVKFISLSAYFYVSFNYVRSVENNLNTMVNFEKMKDKVLWVHIKIEKN